MAAVDPKAAPLAADLKEYALSLENKTFPKNFFCALCSELAIDPWKLLCCNKTICSSCHAKLEFPTTCPSCEHSPVEADSCPPNKALRSTMRIWLQRHKKKEEAKLAVQATPVADPQAPSAATPDVNEAAAQPIASVEEDEQTGHKDAQQSTVLAGRQGSTVPTMSKQEVPPNADDAGKVGEPDNQKAVEGTEDTAQDQSATNMGATNEQGMTANSNNNMMDLASMPNQFGFGFNQNQGGFNNGMGFNGMNNMAAMQQMMGNGGWNMNAMGFNMAAMNDMNAMNNGMYGGYGGNMGMGMNDMSAMGYGGGYGNGWQGMGNQGYGGFNPMGGYNHPGANQGINQYSSNMYNNNSQKSSNFNGSKFPHQRNQRNGSYGGANHKQAFPTTATRSRPESRNGSSQQQRDDQTSPKDVTEPGDEQAKDGQATSPNDTSAAGKPELLESIKPEMAETAAGNEDAPENALRKTENLTEMTGTPVNESSSLKAIQTVDSEEFEGQDVDMSHNDGMHVPPYMMNDYPQQQQNPMGDQFGQNMEYTQHGYGQRGGFNNAYGAATLLTGEPRGLGVEGAPTGPRAMREGRPNTGFQSRVNSARYNAKAASVTPSQNASAQGPLPKPDVHTPSRDAVRHANDRPRSQSRSRSRQRRAERDEQLGEPQSSREAREERDRSRTPHDGIDLDKRKERRHQRSSRYDEREEDDKHPTRQNDGSRGNRTRTASVESKDRSRHGRDKHRSSHSYRERSREHRHRHRSRSADEKHAENDAHAKSTDGSGSRRKSKGEKDKYRDRDRHSSRERDRDRDRDRDRRDRKEKERDRERDHDEDEDAGRKEKDRRRRRDDREEERDYVEEKYLASRRNRKERDGQKELSSATRTRANSPPLNAPTGPSADNFSIRGASRPKAAKTMAPPPTGPRALQPSKGPSADRDKHGRKSSASSQAVEAHSPPAVLDHYAAEREKHARERAGSERGKSSHTRSTSHHLSSSRPSLSSKRSRDDFEPDKDDAVPLDAPKGPSASHRDKRRRSGDAVEWVAGTSGDLASRLTKGLRKKAGSARRGGVKMEGDAEREMERAERERDSRRW